MSSRPSLRVVLVTLVWIIASVPLQPLLDGRFWTRIIYLLLGFSLIAVAALWTPKDPGPKGQFRT
jgi:hypothetical protein